MSTLHAYAGEILGGEIEVNRSYSFTYPDFARPGERVTHRIRVLWIFEWNDDVAIRGVNLETEKPLSVYRWMMEDIRPLAGERRSFASGAVQ